jgi:dihydropteroate synthase
MGILNVTPDSFSDGGAYTTTDAAVAAACRMIEDGADIIDIGGESTRPGAKTIDPALEQQRIGVVIRELAGKNVLISADTRNASTMAAALRAGATIINDVSGLNHDPAAAAVVAESGCAVVLMHMRGTPTTMRGLGVYGDVVEDVIAELRTCAVNAERAGIRREAIMLDPGIGFAKNADQSVALLGGMARLKALGYPLLVGVSRKSFIGTVARERDPRKRLPGSLAAALFALTHGAAILRVHDVGETRQAIQVWSALNSSRRRPCNAASRP